MFRVYCSPDIFNMLYICHFLCRHATKFAGSSLHAKPISTATKSLYEVRALVSVVMPVHSDLTTEAAGTGRRAAVPDGKRPLQGRISLNIFAVPAWPISLEVRT